MTLRIEYLRKWPKGAYTRAFILRRGTPTTLVVYFGLVALAWLVHLDYNPFHDTISNLGSHVHNPRGWWLFSLATIWMAFRLYPVFPYTARRLEPFGRGWARAGRALGVASIGGGILTAIVPEDLTPLGSTGLLTFHVHAVGATLTFSAMILAYAAWWIPLGRATRASGGGKNEGKSGKKFTGKNVGKTPERWGHSSQPDGTPRLSARRHWASAALLLLVVTGFAATQGYAKAADVDRWTVSWASYPFWEWVLWLSLCAYTIWLLVLVPERLGAPVGINRNSGKP